MSKKILQSSGLCYHWTCWRFLTALCRFEFSILHDGWGKTLEVGSLWDWPRESPPPSARLKDKWERGLDGRTLETERDREWLLEKVLLVPSIMASITLNPTRGVHPRRGYGDVPKTPNWDKDFTVRGEAEKIEEFCDWKSHIISETFGRASFCSYSVVFTRLYNLNNLNNRSLGTGLYYGRWCDW